MKRITVIGLCLIGLVLAGCGRTAGDVDVSQVGITEIPIEQRQAAPPIAGPSLASGEELILTSGPITVLNSWASWCAPCLTEMPILIDAQAEHPDVRFLGLNAIDDEVQATQFVEDLGITFDSIRDPGGDILATIPDVPPRALPSTIILDAQGRIAVRIIGPIAEGQLDPILDRLKDEPN